MITKFEILQPFECQKIVYFQVVGSKLNTHDIRIIIENGTALFKNSSCTCIHGSFYSQTRENLKNGKICKHLQEVLNFLERECWIESRQNLDLINNGKIQ